MPAILCQKLILLMRGCELEIVTESNEGRSVFQTEGIFECEKNGERVRYRIENDEAELFFSDAFFENRRYGDFGLEATFREGEESALTVGSSSLKGCVPLKTMRYRIQKSAAGREIELRYDLFPSRQIQTFFLKIKIVFFSEEK